MTGGWPAWTKGGRQPRNRVYWLRVRPSGLSTGFLVVVGLLLLVVGVFGLLAYGGCEDVGSECHPNLPKMGGLALALAFGTFGYALMRGKR
jgi:hypothetical protein